MPEKSTSYFRIDKKTRGMTFGLGGSYFGLVMHFVLSNLAIFDFFDFYFPLVVVCNQSVTRRVVIES